MILTDVLPTIALLYVEAAPFIYFTEQHADYADKMRQVFVRMKAGLFPIVTSAVTLTETLTKPLKDNDIPLVTAYRSLFYETTGISVVGVNIQMGSRAAELRAEYNLRTPDALHLAAALEAGCDAFLTNDVTFKRVQGIKILVLDDLELDPLPPDGAS